ncbi:MAG: head GIN domain-containing protein [Mangrovibacterium sp.]
MKKTHAKICSQTGLVLLALLLSFPLLASNPERQTRPIGHFSKISVSSGVDLFLAQGQQEQLSVEADAELIAHLVTQVEGETLQIYLKKRDNWNWNWDRSCKVYVSFQDLTSLEASAGADVLGEGTIKVGKISLSVSSGADLVLRNLVASEVKIDTSSGSDAELAGSTQVLVASSSSGSDIDCSKLQSVTSTAQASSGSDILLVATGSLTASASSGGDIEYQGKPRQKTIDESSGGSVREY